MAAEKLFLFLYLAETQSEAHELDPQDKNPTVWSRVSLQRGASDLTELTEVIISSTNICAFLGWKEPKARLQAWWVCAK